MFVIITAILEFWHEKEKMKTSIHPSLLIPVQGHRGLLHPGQDRFELYLLHKQIWSWY